MQKRREYVANKKDLISSTETEDDTNLQNKPLN